MTYKSEIFKEALKNILYWKKRADTCPEMLLSSHHGKSEECGKIMKNYEESFKKAQKLLDEENEN